ncbi:diacylglycerol kinase family protein [Cohnella zeiphila]|nr:diacylglycerol kinase family protein [Cohnella zeiphila]
MSGRRRRNRTESESFRNALEGIHYALGHEPHMKFHLLASAIVAIAGAVLRVDAGEWLWLLSAIAAVWVTELLNTGVERAVDLASPDDHELAKIAKDAAAGAVLVASLYAAAVGVIVLGPPLWRAFFGS